MISSRRFRENLCAAAPTYGPVELVPDEDCEERQKERRVRITASDYKKGQRHEIGQRRLLVNLLVRSKFWFSKPLDTAAILTVRIRDFSKSQVRRVETRL